jgi:hypothetical protein
MGDADDSYNFDEIDGFVKYLREGYEMVVGTRLKEESKTVRCPRRTATSAHRCSPFC